MSQDAAALDGILDNLSKRPGVTSTLILTRKDGSIIKASGAIATSGASIAQHRAVAGTDTHQLEGEDSTTSVTRTKAAEEPAQDPQQTALSHTQILAASIFNFVASATSVSEALAQTSSKKIARVKDQEQPRVQTEEAVLSAQANTDVQLLRLRLRKQEVIIYPDPSYLCCVIQDLERGK